MMCKLILVLFVCIVTTCTPGVDGICCKSIMELVENKNKSFTILCGQGNTLPPGCCDDIQKEVESFDNAYKSLCLKASKNGIQGMLLIRIVLFYENVPCELFMNRVLVHTHLFFINMQHTEI